MGEEVLNIILEGRFWEFASILDWILCEGLISLLFDDLMALYMRSCSYLGTLADISLISILKVSFFSLYLINSYLYLAALS
jgi:hypothetical protein